MFAISFYSGNSSDINSVTKILYLISITLTPKKDTDHKSFVRIELLSQKIIFQMWKIMYHDDKN